MDENIFTPKLIDVEMPSYEKNGKTKVSEVFLVMEYYEQNLDSVFSRVASENFTENHVTIIMYNLLCSIKFLHSCNLVHRDLKPANILITE